MSSTDKLLSALNAAADDYHFPGWECGEQNAVVGAMRASGFSSSSGAALVFEEFEYSTKEDVIQSMAYCFATFPLASWVSPGGGPRLHLNSNERGEVPFSSAELFIESRGRRFTIPCAIGNLISEGYLDADAERPTAESLVFRIADVMPREWLFSVPDYIKRAFTLNDAEHLFSIDEWRHPSFQELYGDLEMKPSDAPDIVAMAKAICNGHHFVILSESPNTSWRAQCRLQKG